MDTRNVIAAISLSAAVIILYGLFFAPPSPDPKQLINNDQNKNNLQLNEAPNIEQNIEKNDVPREKKSQVKTLIYISIVIFAAIAAYLIIWIA